MLKDSKGSHITQDKERRKWGCIVEFIEHRKEEESYICLLAFKTQITLLTEQENNLNFVVGVFDYEK